MANIIRDNSVSGNRNLNLLYGAEGNLGSQNLQISEITRMRKPAKTIRKSRTKQSHSPMVPPETGCSAVTFSLIFPHGFAAEDAICAPEQLPDA